MQDHLRNSLHIEFIPISVEESALAAWPVRVKDFATFVQESAYDAYGNMLTIGPDNVDWTWQGKWWKDPGFSQTANHPVVGVSYFDAQAFCQWLTSREKRLGNIPANRYFRLPLDLEWSRAVGLRNEAGSFPEERLFNQVGIYPWGKQWPPPDGFGNYAGEESREGMPSGWGVVPGGYCDPFPKTSPVGSFAPNDLGFFDLSGNVWEWCEDSYCPGSLSRIIRGGSWASNRPSDFLSAQRLPKFPNTRTDDIGFRITLAVQRSV